MDWIDMRSDTVTKPTLEMRAAMASAEVGDDVYQDDPTTNRLEARAAELLGFEAALFITSGTMGNQLALMCNTRRGDEVIAGAECHIVMHEVGAAAVLSGANIRQIPYENGLPVPARIEAAIRPDDIHEPRTALICMENALANGRVVPLDTMREIYTLAHAHGIPVHLDGARIFNAAVALGVDVKDLTQYTDTLTCCLSKGLCAPVGAVFAGSREMVERARRYRKMLGGGMRQNGILAAAGLLALEKMPERLHVDHENARYMASLLQNVPGITLDLDSVEINMVFCKIDRELPFLEALPERMREHGVLIGGYEGGEFRFVTNHGVSRKDVEHTVAALQTVLSE